MVGSTATKTLKGGALWYIAHWSRAGCMALPCFSYVPFFLLGTFTWCLFDNNVHITNVISTLLFRASMLVPPFLWAGELVSKESGMVPLNNYKLICIVEVMKGERHLLCIYHCTILQGKLFSIELDRTDVGYSPLYYMASHEQKRGST